MPFACAQAGCQAAAALWLATPFACAVATGTNQPSHVARCPECGVGCVAEIRKMGAQGVNLLAKGGGATVMGRGRLAGRLAGVCAAARVHCGAHSRDGLACPPACWVLTVAPALLPPPPPPPPPKRQGVSGWRCSLRQWWRETCRWPRCPSGAWMVGVGGGRVGGGAKEAVEWCHAVARTVFTGLTVLRPDWPLLCWSHAALVAATDRPLRPCVRRVLPEPPPLRVPREATEGVAWHPRALYGRFDAWQLARRARRLFHSIAPQVVPRGRGALARVHAPTLPPHAPHPQGWWVDGLVAVPQGALPHLAGLQPALCASSP